MPYGLQFGISVVTCDTAGMKIVIDTDKCEGHNRCYAIAPELIEVDDYGYASAAGDGTVPPELEEKARLAVDNCPEFAVTVIED